MEYHIGRISKIFAGLTEIEIFDKMLILGNSLTHEGWQLMSGKHGAYDELWIRPRNSKNRNM